MYSRSLTYYFAVRLFSAHVRLISVLSKHLVLLSNYFIAVVYLFLCNEVAMHVFYFITTLVFNQKYAFLWIFKITSTPELKWLLRTCCPSGARFCLEIGN